MAAGYKRVTVLHVPFEQVTVTSPHSALPRGYFAKVTVTLRFAGRLRMTGETAEQAHAGDDARAMQEEEARLTERAADIEIRYGLRVVTRVLRGTTARALTHEATDTVADLVVMATHDREMVDKMRRRVIALEDGPRWPGQPQPRYPGTGSGGGGRVIGGADDRVCSCFVRRHD